MRNRKRRIVAVAAAAASMAAMPAYAATKLDAPDGVAWSEEKSSRLEWDEVEHAKKYTVYLYVNKYDSDSDSYTKIGEYSTSKTYLNLRKKMIYKGTYTARVKAVSSRSSYSDSSLSEYSDDLYVENPYDPNAVANSDFGPGVQKTAQTGTDSGSVQVLNDGTWIQDADGWAYSRADGSRLAAESDASPLWAWIDGGLDGSANCYAFDANGRMYVSCQTPDGYEVDENGAWIKDGEVQTKDYSVAAQDSETEASEEASETAEAQAAQNTAQLPAYAEDGQQLVLPAGGTAQEEVALEVDSGIKIETGSWIQEATANGRKLAFRNSDGVRIAADEAGGVKWAWIDSNADGTAECYAFDSNGYAYVNCQTPDGHTVNSDGIWVVEGVIQARKN